MDFFNVGPLELLFLAGIAIIIVGPSRAAEIAGQIGQLVARARRTINSMTEDLRSQAQEETEPLRSARESVRDVESQLRRPLDLTEPRANTGRAEAPQGEDGQLPEPVGEQSDNESTPENGR